MSYVAFLRKKKISSGAHQLENSKLLMRIPCRKLVVVLCRHRLKQIKMKKLDGEEYGASLVRNRAKNFGQFEKKKLWTNCNVKENVKKKKKMKKTCRQKKSELDGERFAYSRSYGARFALL